MASDLGRNWEAINLFAEEPVDMVYATDGWVYIATETKVYKTDLDFLHFTALTLSGVIVTAFGGLAELPNGSIILCDRNNYWLKPAGSDTVTRNTGANLTFAYSYWDKGNNVTAFPDTAEAFRHCTVGNGQGAGTAKVPGNSVWTGGPYWVSDDLTSGWIYEKGVKYGTDRIVFCAGGSKRHSITVYPLASTTRIIGAETGNAHADIYSNHQGTIALEPGTNRLWSMGLKSQTSWFYHYSDDGGETWTDRTAFTFSGMDNLGKGNLKLRIPSEGHFLITLGAKTYLTEDYFTTIEAIQTLDGTTSKELYIFSPETGTTIALLATNGTATANLYIAIEKLGSEEYVEPELLIRWRNDGKPEWSNYRKISLGNSGETEIVKKLRGLGRYRTRQYELVCTSKFPMTIAMVEEFVKLGQGGDGSGS